MASIHLMTVLSTVNVDVRSGSYYTPGCIQFTRRGHSAFCFMISSSAICEYLYVITNDVAYCQDSVCWIGSYSMVPIWSNVSKFLLSLMSHFQATG